MARLPIWSVVLVAGLVVAAERPKPKADPVVKRGLSGWGKRTASVGAAWYYNWWWQPDDGADHREDGGPVADFVPMLKKGTDVNDGSLAAIRKLKEAGKVTCLLGFNEPERKDQGDTTVDRAIDLWPKLTELGLRTGSPAPSSDDKGLKWLDDFMKKAEAKRLRVDFIAVHYYKDASAADAAPAMIKFVDDLHQKYKRPVWVTEFAGFNWSFCRHKVTAQVDQKFMAAVLPLLERDAVVERYAWFSAADGETALFAGDGPTDLGKVYRSHGGVQYGK